MATLVQVPAAILTDSLVQAFAVILEDTVVPVFVALVLVALVLATTDLAASDLAAPDPDTVSQLVPYMVVALTPETGEQVVVRQARL